MVAERPIRQTGAGGDAAQPESRFQALDCALGVGRIGIAVGPVQGIPVRCPTQNGRVRPAGTLLAVGGTGAARAVNLDIVAQLRPQAPGGSVVVVLPAARLVADAGIEREGFTVGCVPAPDAVAQAAASAAATAAGLCECQLGECRHREHDLECRFHASVLVRCSQLLDCRADLGRQNCRPGGVRVNAVREVFGMVGQGRVGVDCRESEVGRHLHDAREHARRKIRLADA